MLAAREVATWWSTAVAGVCRWCRRAEQPVRTADIVVEAEEGTVGIFVVAREAVIR